ncbi:hypothetical protein M405DRAFT_934370 [Rhizopogon salebrosus TDB-379]|nr:hypothetical protein M405DRAFT_934370 [Rhizopogon salebrosus TDB-379]
MSNEKAVIARLAYACSGSPFVLVRFVLAIQNPLQRRTASPAPEQVLFCINELS